MTSNNTTPTLLTVNQFLEKHPAFTHGGLRDRIFYRETNGMSEYNVIVKNGRRVLINEQNFFDWLDNLSHQSMSA